MWSNCTKELFSAAPGLGRIHHVEGLMRVSDELYNPAPLLTFEGAAITVLTASGAIGHAFSFNPRWLSLAIAIVIPLIGLSFLPQERKLTSSLVLVALFHGLVIYNLAVGLNTLHQSVPAPHAATAALVPIVDPAPWWPPAEQERAAEALITRVKIDVAMRMSRRLLDDREREAVFGTLGLSAFARASWPGGPHGIVQAADDGQRIATLLAKYEGMLDLPDQLLLRAAAELANSYSPWRRKTSMQDTPARLQELENHNRRVHEIVINPNYNKETKDRLLAEEDQALARRLKDLGP